MPLHQPVWMDLATHSGRDIASFYNAVCGWEAAESSEEFGGYFMFFANGLPVAGAMPTPVEHPGGWTMYVEVADVTTTLADITSAGGMVFAGPIPIADLGIMAVVADQSGATFGLWQPGTFPGFPLSGDVGTPLWFELYTKDYDGSKRFFTEVFSWTFDTVSDTPEFAYSTVSFNGEPKVGIMDFSAPVHDAMAGYWNAYVRVGDCDEAARAVEHAGGTVLMSPTDSPFGRMASVRDRDGSVFSLMQALG